MGKKKRRGRVEHTDDWGGLLPLFAWPEQERYEEIRPPSLSAFSHPASSSPKSLVCGDAWDVSNTLGRATLASRSPPGSSSTS